MTSYYIKNGGNDALDGLSDANAWETIAKLNTMTLSAGDIIYLNRGDEWRETIYKAAAQHGVTVTAYGTGDRPIITGRDELTGWDNGANWTAVTTINKGNTTMYASSSSTANRRGYPVTFYNAALITSVTIYHNGGTDNALFGIYADATGSPGARLGVTASTAINAGAGWQTFDLIAPVNVVAGTTVWIAWVFQTNPGIRYQAGTTRAQSADVWAGGMPDPFGAATYDDYSYSVYCTATVSNVYSFDMSVLNPTSMRLFTNTGAGYTERRKQRSLDVSATDVWYFDGTADLLYLYSVASPETLYTGMELSGIRSYCVNLYSDQNWTLSELDLRGAYICLNLYNASGTTIINCDIGIDCPMLGIVGEGTALLPSNGVTITNCTFDSGLRLTFEYEAEYCEDALSINGSCLNWSVHDNLFNDWAHSNIYLKVLSGSETIQNIDIYGNEFTAPDISYGRAINIDIIEELSSNIQIHNNWIHDMPTQNQINAHGVSFYHNIINNITGVAWESGVGVGISISIYAYTVQINEMGIYNNVIANCEDYGIALYNFRGNAGYFIQDNIFANNIFYNNNSDTDIQLYIQEETGPIEDKILNNTYKNNLFYKAGVSDLVYYRGSSMTVTEFNAENGNAWSEVISNNIAGDPLFVSSVDFELQEGSPAIDTGIDVGLTQDYIGNVVPYGTMPDIGAYEWFAVPAAFTNITLVSTPACVDLDNPTIVSRWVATECPINFRLLRRDWYVISCAESGGYLAVNIYGTFAGADSDVISVYDETTLSMYTGTITDSSTAPVLVTSILWVDGMDIKYLNDHTLYAGYYFEGRLTINGVVEPLTIIASPDSFGYADLDVSAILRTKTRVGKLTNYLNRIMKDSYKSGSFTLEYRGRWWGSAEAWTQEGSVTSPPSTVVWYYAECVRSIEQGCNLSEYVPTDLLEAKWLNQFETPVYWYGLPFDISFILPEMIELSPAIELTVTTKVYDSENFQLGGDIVEYVDVDALEGYVNNLSVDSTLIPVGASYFTVEITAP